MVEEKVRLWMLGAAGQARSVTTALGGDPAVELVGVFDDDLQRIGTDFRGLTVVGPLPRTFSRDGSAQLPKADAAVAAIGASTARRAVVQARPGWRWQTVQHRMAAVNDWDVVIGDGTVMLPHTVVGANARIGEHTILNSGAIVAHGVFIGGYVHIGANAVIAGGATIHDGVFVGIGTMVNPGCTIGAGTRVGAGSVVSKNLPPNVVAVGSPARVIRELGEPERW
jgi:sugar O-acyltransferase (sialic acid O-acetyltransferase NeuD family)